MRTTIDVPEDLFRRVKATAALRGVTLKEFFLEALTRLLDEEREPVKYGQDRPVPVAIPPKGRRLKSFTNSALEQIFLKEEMEQWD